MCDSVQRSDFMFRLAKAIGKKKSVVFTGEPIVKINAYLHGIKCVYLREKKVKEKIGTNYKIYEQSIEYLNHKISLSQCYHDAWSAYQKIEQYIIENTVDYVVIWNGQQLLGRVLSEIAKKYQLKTLFLEISNLPNKLFVDPVGVNALSSIQIDPSMIKSFNAIDPEMHRRWIELYKAEKRKPLPQANEKYSDHVKSAVNLLLKKITSGIGGRNLFSIDEIKNKYKFRYITVSYDDCSSIKDYLFLPLQVSSDTQLKLHSRYNNIQIIEYAVELAKHENMQLVVKIHPAERDVHEIKKIIDLKQKFQFHLSNQNTIQLIENSQKVITINSTVGLEAKIFGKEVIVLGDALYSHFGQDEMKRYIHGFLIDNVDYFSDHEISEEKVNEILGRAI
jgi:capsular polysaccharide export protein